MRSSTKPYDVHFWVQSGHSSGQSPLLLLPDPPVATKVTGLDIDDASNWTAADIAPYVDRALDLFGPERLMFGSDWPVANLRGGYNKVWRETNLALARLSSDERDRILGGTAIEFYRLPIIAPSP